jgi:hypothetical protein
MHGGSSHSGTELFVTRDFVGLHLSEQIGSHRPIEVVIILFVSETACHSTTFDLRRHNVESDRFEHVDGLPCCVTSALL